MNDIEKGLTNFHLKKHYILTGIMIKKIYIN